MPDVAYSIALPLLCDLCPQLLGHRIPLLDVPNLCGYVIQLLRNPMLALLANVPRSRSGHLVHLPDLSTEQHLKLPRLKNRDSILFDFDFAQHPPHAFDRYSTHSAQQEHSECHGR